MNNKTIAIIVSVVIVVSVLLAAGYVFIFSFRGCINIGQTQANNGEILAQYLNANNQGYTVMRVWGSYYQIGYAHGELLGCYIIEGINEMKNLIGTFMYKQVRDAISNSFLTTSNIEDELDGIVAGLAKSCPNSGVDKIDLKVINTAGDWLYEYACRSHTCWGRYVEEPIKTLSTRRLDYDTFIPTLNHHLLCIYIPNDGSTKWINLAFPGIVVTMTGVNEYGTLASIHDWSYMEESDLEQRTMSRLVAIRYALTYPTSSDISTHLSSVYNELQNYEIMTSSYLNYYVPEGYGGIMTCYPWRTGSDLYELRLPQDNWHHGEAIITTNSDTDGTYTPWDEDFGADSYYNDETPKTLESHWNLLNSSYPEEGLHRISIAYRNQDDMTIWVDGRLDGIGRTPRLEYEWSELFDL